MFPAMQAHRNHLWILLAASTIFYAIFIFRTAFDADGQRIFILLDEAMISMRYARNLVQGHGLVWNVGQPPVEGFTNLGWMLVMALVHFLPFSATKISLVLMLIAAAILLSNTIVVFQIAQTLEPSAQFAPMIAATTTAFYFPLVFWTLRGVEVGALTLTLSLALLFAFRTLHSPPSPASVFWLSLLLCLSLLIRMDAVLPVALILAYLGVALAAPARRKVTQRDDGEAWYFLTPALAAVFTFAAILLFQKTYFGDFLPNTYYLKLYGATIWERVYVGLLALYNHALREFLMPLVFVGVGLSMVRDLRTRSSLLLLSLFFAQISYSVWVGGDYAEELVASANRFITQGMPALLILFALVMERFLRNWPRIKPSFAFVIGLVALFVISGEPWGYWVIRNAPMLPTDIQRARLGLHIRKYTTADAVIAVHAAGEIPYFSERTTIDLLGKSDPVIARGTPAGPFTPGHNKWNYEYSILQLRPDVIADNFYMFKSFISDVSEYQQLDNGIYVLVSTTKVDLDGLSRDYR